MFALAFLAACPAPKPASRPVSTLPGITWQRVQTARDVPPPPTPGSYQIHLIDVGTGLAVLVRGEDFAMLFDGGSNDRDENPSRVAAYRRSATPAMICAFRAARQRDARSTTSC